MIQQYTTVLGLQGSSRVQQSHSFWEEAVPQSGSPALNAPQRVGGTNSVCAR